MERRVMIFLMIFLMGLSLVGFIVEPCTKIRRPILARGIRVAHLF
jgi:hypothetical protein